MPIGAINGGDIEPVGVVFGDQGRPGGAVHLEREQPKVSSGGKPGPGRLARHRVQGRGCQSRTVSAAGRGQRVAVGREGQAEDRPVMASQGRPPLVTSPHPRA